jgi:hypothetical protein
MNWCMFWYYNTLYYELVYALILQHFILWTGVCFDITTLYIMNWCMFWYYNTLYYELVYVLILQHFILWTGVCFDITTLYRSTLLYMIQPTISLEMPVPSQGHYGFHSLRLLTNFVCLYSYEFWLSLCKIVRSSVILLLPLFTVQRPYT